MKKRVVNKGISPAFLALKGTIVSNMSKRSAACEMARKSWAAICMVLLIGSLARNAYAESCDTRRLFPHV